MDKCGADGGGELESILECVSIPCGAEVVGALVRPEVVEEEADAALEATDGALRGLTQQGLELGEGHFDGVEVG